MTGHAAALERRLPRGSAQLTLRFTIWLGFHAAYQVARGAADHGGRALAFANGEWIIELQRYFRAHERVARLRDTLIVATLIALVMFSAGAAWPAVRAYRR